MIVDFLQQFKQANKGDTQGTIWSTKNIDPVFNNGKVNISHVLGRKTTTTEQANLAKAPVSFTFAEDKYYAVADYRVWESASAKPNSSWTEVSGTPTNCSFNSEIINFNGKRYVATDGNLKSYSIGSGWVDIDTLGATGHSMCVYSNRLYVVDNLEKIYSMNTSEAVSKTGSYTIDLNLLNASKQVITKILPVSDGIWIATLFSDSVGGEIIKWDGQTENVTTARYKLSRGAMTMVIKDNRPYILDSLGCLRVFDGTSFEEVACLPIENNNLTEFNAISNKRWIHPNGSIIMGDEIYFLIDATLNDTTQDPIERLPAGVWAYNKDKGLYHKYSLVDSDISVTTPVINDFGQAEIVKAGALYNAQATTTGLNKEDESEFLAGIQYYTDATNTKAAFCFTNIKNDIQKAGYFVTSQLQTSGFNEQWQEAVAVYDQLKNSTDRIILKYRDKEIEPIYATGVWSDDNIIRTTDDLSTVRDGDEIEIIRGVGSGLCAHIKITGTGSYRLTLDENQLSGMTGTCRFRIQRWTKIGTENNTDTTYFRKVLDGSKSSWVQFKMYLVGTGKSPQVHKLLSISQSAEGIK